MNETTPRYIMIGGFLGAGKTTSILKFARWLTETKGLRVGLITNDQAEGLVDTALARDAKIVTEEIAGGCFCCRSASLVEATERLTEKNKPDVFIAEPVGSCTDLVATVSLPLATIYRKDYAIAPLSVVIDPFRALRILSAEVVPADQIRTAPGFSEDINYIYRKQLEEAEIIVVNKCEILSPERLTALQNLIARQFPRAEVLPISARDGIGLVPWWEMLMSRTLNVEQFMEVDYARYAEGEALLGWVNGTYYLSAHRIVDRSASTADPLGSSSPAIFDGNQTLDLLCSNLRKALFDQNIEVAHLKMTLQSSLTNVSGPVLETKSPGATSELAAVQLVSTDSQPEFTQRLDSPLSEGTLTVNMRAEADPETLSQALGEVMKDALLGIHVDLRYLQSFRPAPPNSSSDQFGNCHVIVPFGSRNYLVPVNLSAFKDFLNKHAAAQLRFVLPGGDFIPMHAHITEVGRVEKTFIDCGGTIRQTTTCCLQAWFADDVEHRILSGKLTEILDRAAPLLRSEEMEVEVEYEDFILSQYSVTGAKAEDGTLLFLLQEKHTDCLAKEICLPEATGGCDGNGCC